MRSHAGSSARGFSLVEAVLAIGILSVVLSGSYYLYIGTARNAYKAAAMLAEALLAQMVVREVRDAMVSNPKYLANLTSAYGFERSTGGEREQWVSFGTAAPLDRPVQTAEGPLTPSPLVQAALGRTARSAEVLAPELARLSPEDRARVLETLKRLAVKVTLSDAGREMEFLGSTYNGGSLKELLKRIDVEVFWVPAGSLPQPWLPDYRLSSEVQAPEESLTTAALTDLQAEFDTLDLEPAIQEVLVQLKEKSGFQSADGAALDIAARMFLIFREVNVEAFMTEGRPLIATPPDAKDPAALDAQIAALAPLEGPYFRKRQATLTVKKAVLLLDTFRRVRKAVAELTELHRQFESEVEAARAQLVPLLQRSRTTLRGLYRPRLVPQFWRDVIGLATTEKDYRAYVDAHRAVLAKALLFEYLFSEEKLLASFDRLKDYPRRFRETLGSAEALYLGLAADEKATWLTQASALHEALQLEIALKLLGEGAAGAARPEAATLERLGARWRTGFPLLADYVQQSDLLGPPGELVARNPGFLAVSADLDRLATPESPIEQLILRYRRKGTVSEYLTDTGRVPVNFRTGLVVTGLAGRKLKLPDRDVQQAIDQIAANLPEAVEPPVRIGINSVQELEELRLPSRKTRVKRRKELLERGPRPGRSLDDLSRVLKPPRPRPDDGKQPETIGPGGEGGGEGDENSTSGGGQAGGGGGDDDAAIAGPVAPVPGGGSSDRKKPKGGVSN